MQLSGFGRCADADAAGGCYASEVQSYCFFAEYANFLRIYFCTAVLCFFDREAKALGHGAVRYSLLCADHRMLVAYAKEITLGAFGRTRVISWRAVIRR